MSATARVLRAVTSTLLVAAVAVLVAVVVGRGAGWSIAPVLTGSMRPAFAPGDLVVSRPVPVTELQPGQVAVFVPPGESARYAHRVVEVRGTTGARFLHTKGDANPTADGWRTPLTTPTVPVVTAHVPYAGHLLVHLNGPGSRALLVALIGLSLTALAVRLVLVTPAPATAAT